MEILFDRYDVTSVGEISDVDLFSLYRELRPPGVRTAQVAAALETLYGCNSDTLYKLDVEHAIRELDRRYFLLQDLEWEYKCLARRDGLISEEDSRLLFTATHHPNFSLRKFQTWLSGRVLKGSGVPFNEIDVLLCNIPTTDEIIAELPSVPLPEIPLGRSSTTVITDKTKSFARQKKLEKLSYLRKLQELKAKRSDNLKQRKKVETSPKPDDTASVEATKEVVQDEQKKEERKQKEEEERKQREEEERERKVKEERKQKEDERKQKEEEERQQKEEEERKQKEEERKQKEEEERKQKEEEERQQKEEEERQQKKEEERLRKEEEERLKREEAERQAQLEAEKESERVRENLEKSQSEEEQAREMMKEADEALQRAKEQADAAAIEEAERKKKEAEKKKLKAEIVKKLSEAMNNKDITMLEDTLQLAKKKKVEGIEDITKQSEELLDLLYAGLNLENAVRDRHIENIEAAITKVKKEKTKQKTSAGGYEKVLATKVHEAETLLVKLKRLEFLKRQVMELKQQTIAELKSYQQPPPIVKFVMTATFLILGHNGKDIQKWNQMVVLMGKTGKEALKRRVQQFEPDTMPWNVATSCQEILAGMDTASVADVSAGAAAFYVWCEGMVEERLSLPKEISKELKEKRKQLDRRKSNENLMKGGTVEVMSRRSRSRDRIEVPKGGGAGRRGSTEIRDRKPNASRSRSRGPATNAQQKKKEVVNKRK